MGGGGVGWGKNRKKIHANKKCLKKNTCKQTCLKKDYKQNNNRTFILNVHQTKLN